MPGDRPVVLRPGHVEPDGFDVLDALGLERVCGRPAVRLIAAADDDGNAQLGEAPGRLQAEPLVGSRDERDLVLICHDHAPRSGDRSRSRQTGCFQALDRRTLLVYTSYMEDVKPPATARTRSTPTPCLCA